ncbi:MAG TPA: redoxin domain-containing protein [Candidatus Limnocylindria bacterium]|nr:redoxin domain-containing protein [Candidatus Limnocylindria bacterium]
MPARCARLVILLLLSAAAPAGANPGQEILDRVVRTYQNLSSCDFAGRIAVAVRTGGDKTENELRFLVAADSTGRIREELREPSHGVLGVADGTHHWQYRSQTNEYVKGPPPLRRTDAGAPKVSGIPGGLSANMLHQFRGLSAGASEVKYVRDEAVDVAGVSRKCFVLDVTSKSASPGGVQMEPKRLWIDSQQLIVLRQQIEVRGDSAAGRPAWRRTETITFDRATVDRALDDSLFVFRAPAGATEVASFSQGPQPGDLSGKVAADFTLKGLDGKTTTLSKLRGKVVLLDFWATWCGPCRIEMPRLQTLHREFKTKGLVVLGINQRETPKRAQDFMKKYGYTFPTLLDTQSAVAEKYQVQGIPTLVVVDPKGTIAAHFIGVREEAVLREALKKAGLK